jgi:hypothetical protein
MRVLIVLFDEPPVMAPDETKPLRLRSTHIKGRDHLGIQVVSMSLYSQLLPGLTNVTHRIRYYSFYPWILHRYANDVRRASERTWQEHLRRAEILSPAMDMESPGNRGRR